MRCLLQLVMILFLFVTSPTIAEENIAIESEISKIQTALLLGLNPVGEKQLANAQTAWKIFKDTECRYLQTNYPFLTSYADCNRALNLKRLNEMRQQLEWLHSLAGSTAEKVGSCVNAAGRSKAERLMRRCLAVTNGQRSLCNINNSCNLITREIKRGCTSFDANTPSFCSDYH